MFCPIASDLCAFRFFVINGWPPAAGPHYRQSPDPRTNDLRDSPVAPHVARLPREPRPALEPGAAPRLTACTVPLAHQHHSRDRSNSCSAIERGGRLLQCPTCARRPSAQRRARARARWLWRRECRWPVCGRGRSVEPTLNNAQIPDTQASNALVEWGERLRKGGCRRELGRHRAGESKVTPPPENGRFARTKERNDRLPYARSRSLSSVARRRVVAVCHYVTASLLEPYTEGMFWLQVEERDSGTESDDEAERADTGECSHSWPTS